MTHLEAAHNSEKTPFGLPSQLIWLVNILYLVSIWPRAIRFTNKDMQTIRVTKGAQQGDISSQLSVSCEERRQANSAESFHLGRESNLIIGVPGK